MSLAQTARVFDVCAAPSPGPAKGSPVSRFCRDAAPVDSRRGCAALGSLVFLTLSSLLAAATAEPEHAGDASARPLPAVQRANRIQDSEPSNIAIQRPDMTRGPAQFTAVEDFVIRQNGVVTKIFSESLCSGFDPSERQWTRVIEKVIRFSSPTYGYQPDTEIEFRHEEGKWLYRFVRGGFHGTTPVFREFSPPTVVGWLDDDCWWPSDPAKIGDTWEHRVSGAVTVLGEGSWYGTVQGKVTRIRQSNGQPIAELQSQFSLSTPTEKGKGQKFTGIVTYELVLGANYLRRVHFRSTSVQTRDDGQDVTILITPIDEANAARDSRPTRSAVPQIVRRGPLTYPPALLREEVEGVAVITCVVGTDGKARDLAVKEATRPEFGSAALDYVASFVFAPAIDEKGQPVAANFTAPVRFKLK